MNEILRLINFNITILDNILDALKTIKFRKIAILEALQFSLSHLRL